MIRVLLLVSFVFTPLFVGLGRCGVLLWSVFTSYPGTTKYEKFVLGCTVLGLVDVGVC